MEIFERGSAFESCKKILYLIPEGENELVLEAKALSESENKTVRIDLSEFPQKKAGLSKWKVTLEFTDNQTLDIAVEDIGLGQMMPGSGKVIHKTVQLE